MSAGTKAVSEWVDGFLFVGNRPILDFLNTRPVLEAGPTELLPDAPALERWLIASGTVSSTKDIATLRLWRNSPKFAAFLKALIAFRERLREAVLRIESGLPVSPAFLSEVNGLLLLHPQITSLVRRDGKLVQESRLELRKPVDLWAPIADATAELIAETESSRIRKCETCVVHFFDTSKKGSRRWCSMNICGNKLKVSAYQRRKRAAES